MTGFVRGAFGCIPKWHFSSSPQNAFASPSPSGPRNVGLIVPHSSWCLNDVKMAQESQQHRPCQSTPFAVASRRSHDQEEIPLSEKLNEGPTEIGATGLRGSERFGVSERASERVSERTLKEP